MTLNPMTLFRAGGGMFPGDPFLSLHREMNRLFDDLFRGASLPASAGSQPRHLNPLSRVNCIWAVTKPLEE